MSRDSEIVAIFEKTDDAIHGVWAYYAYAQAACNCASDVGILGTLPSAHPMTHDWARVYDPADLVAVMKQVFPHYHTLMCLLAIAGIFEAALHEFWTRLETCGIPQQKGKNREYRFRLDWAFDRLSKTTYGTQGMLSRLDQNRRDIDHVRRLRNCFLHNNGLFNTRYEQDALPVKGRKELHPDYYGWTANPTQNRTIILGPQDFDRFYKAHLEVLHQLHDVLQRENFGYEGPGYSYAEEGKAIEWSKMLTGM
jgi:hypothetical protein